MNRTLGSHIVARRARGLAGAALGILCAAPASALDPTRAITQYGHDVWRTKDGLPQNSVRAVLQTRDGYLWLGTLGGLVRFDGVRFTVFDRSNTPELRDNRISALREGAEGTLWIGTAAGGLTRLVDGAFETDASPSDDVFAARARRYVRALGESRTGGLWIGTNGSGLHRLREGPFQPPYLSGKVVTAVLEDAAGVVWVGTSEGALRFRPAAAVGWSFDRAGLPQAFVNAMAEDRHGAIWIAARGGLTRMEGGRVTTYTRRDGFPAEVASALCEDRHGNLWIGTLGGGLVRMSGGRFTSFTTAHGLSDNDVLSIHEDREGSLWVGSRDGLNRFRDGHFTALTTREGLANDTVNSVHAGRDGSVWIGTDGGGLARVKDGHLTAYTARSGLPSDFVGPIYEASDGSLWLGADGRVGRLRAGRGVVFTARDGVPPGFVSTIGEDAEGRLLIGVGENALRQLRAGRFVPYLPEPEAIEYRYSMQRARNGGIWFGTTGGLVHLQDGRYRVYTTADGLPDDGVHSVYEDAEGILWLATLGGLARLRDGVFHSFARERLLSEVIFQVLEDDNGHLWMNSRRGVLRVRKAELDEMARGVRAGVEVRVYDTADGLKSAEHELAYIQPAACRTRDGRLWFATTKGVVSLDPARPAANLLPPPMRIESFLADGEPVPEDGRELPPGRSRFEFQFTGLSLLAPAKVRFRYLLEGFDSDWVEAGTRRAAYYTNLPPGSYRFRVTACNNDGVWSEEGAMLDFTLAPHFYQTRSFTGALAVLALLGLWGLYRARLARIEAQFATVMKERNRMAREIHDTLAQALVAIGMHLDGMREDPSPTNIGQQVDKARALVKGSLADARRSIWDLPPQYLEEGDLAWAVSHMVEEMVSGTSLKVAVTVSGPPQRLGPAVERNVYRIAQEALTNAVRHARAERIRIELGFEDGSLRLRVVDDGRGFDTARPGASGDGFGMTSMRQRAEHIGARLTVSSRPWRGTRVELAVPVR